MSTIFIKPKDPSRFDLWRRRYGARFIPARLLWETPRVIAVRVAGNDTELLKSKWQIRRAAAAKKGKKKNPPATVEKQKYIGLCTKCQHEVKLRPGVPYYRSLCPICGGKVEVEKASKNPFPKIRWGGTAPPRAWQDKQYARALRNKKIKDPVAFVRWLWEKHLSEPHRTAIKRNPFINDVDTKEAYRFYKRFMGRPADKRTFVQIPKPPRVGAVLGDLVQVSYQTRREGDTEAIEYYHRFTKPLPKLLTDPKGKRLFIAGGKHKVTERGIVG